MTETIVEQVKLEAPAEEAFQFLSDTENFCTFVRWAEISRRVDLSRSSWLLKGPEGAKVEYEPELLSKCLMSYRNRWVHGSASQGTTQSSPQGSELDAVLDHAELDFKRRSDGTTLLLLTYLTDHADRADLMGEGRSQGPDDRSANLDLVVILSNLYSNLFHPPGAQTVDPSREEPTQTPIEPTSLRDTSTKPEEPVASRDVPASADTDALISLLDEWAAEDPAYDEETLPALKENLDRNRPEYRKLFDHR